MDADSTEQLIAAKSLQDDFLSKDIVIIGAGIAGLSCAKALKELGFQNVKILEAKSEVGGRTNTRKYDSTLLELGAQWIHGETGNLIYDIAAKNNLIDMSAPKYMSCIRRFSGYSEDERTVYEEALHFLERQLQGAATFASAPPGSSLWVDLQRSIQQISEKWPKNPNMDNFFMWFSNFLCELIGCEDLNKASARLLDVFSDLPGCQNVELKNGFCDVVNVIAESFPKEWILLQKNVLNIDWCRDGGENSEITAEGSFSYPVKIICEDGSHIFAHHVVVTIPLGCLKKNCINLFTPHLPPQKQLVIDCLGFGIVNKIYLEFEHPFWESNDIFNVICDFTAMSDFESKIKSAGLLKSTEGDCFYPWYIHINRFSFVRQQPKMLCAWITGKGAFHVEKISAKEIEMGCVRLLEIVLQKRIPNPINIIKSNWKSDPFCEGSYSYLSKECEQFNVTHVDLSYPLYSIFQEKKHLTVLFGGEATHPHYFGTVHGAYETGIREANRIYSFYRPHKVIPPPVGCHKLLDCIIIGGGVAGIECARELLTNGLRSVIVFEALDRIGGRIHSVSSDSGTIELGAQWIHGKIGNAVYDVCQENHLIQEEIPITEGKGKFCTSNGEVISKPIVEEVLGKINEIKKQICTKYHYHICTIASVLQTEFSNYMNSCYDTEEIKAVKWAVFKWFLRFEVIDNACDDLNDIDTVGYTQWFECAGFYYNTVKNGFQSFIEVLMREFPPNTVLTSQPVKCVHYSDTVTKSNLKHSVETGPIVVETTEGNFYTSKVVVVTPSVGFLKVNMDTFFQPPLPHKKRAAVQNIGFGTINKIFLEFQEPIMKDDVYGLQLLWLEESKAFEKFCKPDTNWVNGLSGFDRVAGMPNLLLAWVGGPYAKEMELLSEEEIGATCIEILKEFLQRNDIPFPVKVTRSQWNSNRFIKGSFSYIHKDFRSSGCLFPSLTEPLYAEYVVNCNVQEVPIVLFAGEAYSRHYFGSVHGAYNSGKEAASRVLECLRMYEEDSAF